jgi:hypothetical protein
MQDQGLIECLVCSDSGLANLKSIYVGKWEIGGKTHAHILHGTARSCLLTGRC